MKEVDRRTLMKWMAGYRQQHLLYDKRWKDFQEPMVPELFEVSFGRTGKDDLPPLPSDPWNCRSAIR